MREVGGRSTVKFTLPELDGCWRRGEGKEVLRHTIFCLQQEKSNEVPEGCLERCSSDEAVFVPSNKGGIVGAWMRIRAIIVPSLCSCSRSVIQLSTMESEQLEIGRLREECGSCCWTRG